MVSFSQAEYDAIDGKADIVLVLSQPLDIIVNGSFVSDAGGSGNVANIMYVHVYK